MTEEKRHFWDWVETAREMAQAGDKAAASRAIQEARKTISGMAEDLRMRRHELLNMLASMIAAREAPPKHEDQAVSTGYGITSHTGPIASCDRVAPAQRILVCGIGRSGTTLIYQQLAKLLLLGSRKVNFRYEPYLWNIHSHEAKGNPFDMSQLHHFGILAHSCAPLFLEGEHAFHDSFIDHLFNEPWDGDSNARPDSYLTKEIRGSGRLRSYLKRFPDLKIVACLRNPLDTINSSLGMFSFFGEEFHSDDRPRFRAELAARGKDVSQLDVPNLAIEWYANWWRVFTDETLAVAKEHPDNMMLFCYETFQKAPRETLESLMAFVGIHNLGMFIGLSKPAGPTIKATGLTQHDIKTLKPQIDYYTDTVLKPRLGEHLAQTRADSVLSRYMEGRFSFPIAGSDLGRRCPIQLRDMIFKNAKSPFLALVQRPPHPISLDDLISLHHPTDPSFLRKQPIDCDSIKKGKRFGVVITCHNNATTIVDAILSCLNQTLPFDEIVVVNDKSTDNSAAVLAQLGERYSCLKILHLPSNLGPSAARDLGIRKLGTDFFTQLDGDDLFWPTKNAQESAALAGDESVVAFSDILLVRSERSFIQSTAAYDRMTNIEAWRALLARTPQIPRDMTVSRQLYFKAGGYDITRHLYEDWDFKLRLAIETKGWIRADGLAGTIYNRLSPGLSGVDDGEHARALSQIFLSALKNRMEIPHDEFLPAFDSAMGRFKERHVATSTRAALEACIARNSGLDGLSDLAMRRDMRAVDNMHYVVAMDSYTGKSQCEIHA